MKSVEGWADWEDDYGELQNGNGDNSSGFNVLPGGFRDSNGSFSNIRYNAFFWSATENDNNNAWYRILNNNFGFVFRNYYIKSFGASVRCLRD
jgi:uncharacterized protein (TIGR02145 family)